MSNHPQPRAEAHLADYNCRKAYAFPDLLPVEEQEGEYDFATCEDHGQYSTSLAVTLAVVALCGIALILV